MTEEHTGGSSSYYDIEVNALTCGERRRTVKVTISCNEIMKALCMNYAQGNIFKAVWRICAAKLGKTKKGNNTFYDAEKIHFFSKDVMEQEQ